MRDLTFALFLLGTCAGLGVPLIRWFPAERFRMRYLAAPACGLAVIGVFSALGYRYGLAPWLCAALASGAAAAALAWSGLRAYRLGDQQSSLRVGLIVGAAVLVLSIAPKWTGGAQFSALQGNHYDQINYMSYAATARKFSYQELLSFDASAKKQANFYSLVSENLDDRFGISVIYAGFVDLLRFDTTEVTYAYMAALQTMFFFAAAFVLVQLAGALTWRVWLCASAAALGFPIQYVIDINAWSELGSIPIAAVALIFVLDRFDPAVLSAMSRTWQFQVAAGLLFGSLLYIYPEITPVIGAGIIVSAAFMSLREGVAASARIACAGVIQAGAAVLLCLPYLHGTLRWLLAQMSSAIRARPDWWMHFDRYLYDAGAQAIANAEPLQHWQFLKLAWLVVAVPADFVLAALGLYFILPGAGAAHSVGWTLLDCVYLLALLLTAALVWAAIFRPGERPRRKLFLIGVLAMAATVSVIGISGRYWVAGKGLSMIQPLLFICASAPVWAGSRRWAMQLPSLALIGLYLAFGLARPIAAANPSGIHYAPPYLSVLEPDLKQRYRWDFSRYDKAIRGCKAVILDVDNVVLERYAQVFLIGFDVPWYSTHPVDPNWGSGPNLGMQTPLPGADCALSSQRGVDYGSAKVLPLWADTAR